MSGAPEPREDKNPALSREVVAWALYRALEGASPAACVSGEPCEGETSVIDGCFDLYAVADRFIAEIYRKVPGVDMSAKAE
jgi:hypothetical protein